MLTKQDEISLLKTEVMLRNFHRDQLKLNQNNQDIILIINIYIKQNRFMVQYFKRNPSRFAPSFHPRLLSTFKK